MTSRSFAVVTGASSGIGRELARAFAGNGFDLLITAEDDALAAVADELGAGGASVDAVRIDLAADGGVDDLYERIRALGRPVDAIALNAGIGAGGSFAGPGADRTRLEDELRVIDLNVRSFVQSFALALRAELKDTEVTVTSLMPGPTDTEFFERADMLDTKVGASDKDDPADVARQGFEAMMAGDDRVVAGSLKTKLQGKASRFVPDAAKSAMHRDMAEPGSGR